MQVAVVTFDGFNEIDAFAAAHILNRLRLEGVHHLAGQRRDLNERRARARVTYIFLHGEVRHADR